VRSPPSLAGAALRDGAYSSSAASPARASAAHQELDDAAPVGRGAVEVVGRGPGGGPLGAGPVPGVEEDVRRLDVPVEDADPLGGVEGLGDLAGDLDGPPLRERPGPGQAGLEGLAGHERHHEEGSPVERARREEPHDVGGVEGGDGLGFALEALEQLAREAGVLEDLGGDLPAGPATGRRRPVDDPHAAPPELLEDLVAPEPLLHRHRPSMASALAARRRPPWSARRPPDIIRG